MGFGEDDLRALAGTRSFERGLGYLDAVSGLEVGEGSGWCDCPHGQEGNDPPAASRGTSAGFRFGDVAFGTIA